MQPVPPSAFCSHMFSKQVPRTKKPELRHPKQAEMYMRERRPWAPYGYETQSTDQCQRCGMSYSQYNEENPWPALPPKKKPWWQRRKVRKGK